MTKPFIEREFDAIMYDGSVETKSLIFNQYALVKFEEALGITVQELVSRFRQVGAGGIGVRDIHLMFWAGMEGARFQNDKIIKKQTPKMSVDDACEYVDGVGGMMKAAMMVMEILPQSLIGPDEVEALEKLAKSDEAQDDPNPVADSSQDGSEPSEQPPESESTETISGS